MALCLQNHSFACGLPQNLRPLFIHSSTAAAAALSCLNTSLRSITSTRLSSGDLLRLLGRSLHPSIANAARTNSPILALPLICNQVELCRCIQYAWHFSWRLMAGSRVAWRTRVSTHYMPGIFCFCGKASSRSFAVRCSHDWRLRAWHGPGACAESEAKSRWKAPSERNPEVALALFSLALLARKNQRTSPSTKVHSWQTLFHSMEIGRSNLPKPHCNPPAVHA